MGMMLTLIGSPVSASTTEERLLRVFGEVAQRRRLVDQDKCPSGERQTLTHRALQMTPGEKESQANCYEKIGSTIGVIAGTCLAWHYGGGDPYAIAGIFLLVAYLCWLICRTCTNWLYYDESKRNPFCPWKTASYQT